ncbi:MAG: site-specific integrase [Ktedonobacteraceae bacterium]|nr:site-specific integrase [Ktedonobacteraceae bacterium]MBA3824127.1 site-specific integrase [Ktedonobacterales bacterium]
MSKRGQNEGSIYKRDDGRWVAVLNLGYVDGKRKRKYLYGDTRKEVQEQLNAALHDQQHNMLIVNDKMTVEQYMRKWLDEVVQPPRKRIRTHHLYDENVRLYINPMLGKIAISKLTPLEVQGFVNALVARGYKPRTVQIAHGILRNALNQALRWGMVQRNVASLVTLPQAQKVEQKFLTPEEARILLDHIKGERLEALFTVALALGLRKSEALGIRWQDINFERKTATVQVELVYNKKKYTLEPLKTANGRRLLALPQFAVDALLTHRENQAQDQVYLGEHWHNDFGLVFATSLGTPLSSRNVTRSFHRLLAEAGLERMRFYDMRHTCASLLLAQGVPLRVVMEILGHSQISLTANTYTHVIQPLVTDAASRLDDLFKPSSQ